LQVTYIPLETSQNIAETLFVGHKPVTLSLKNGYQPCSTGTKKITPATDNNCYSELQSGSQPHSMGRFIIPLHKAISYYTERIEQKAISYYTERIEQEAPQYHDI